MVGANLNPPLKVGSKINILYIGMISGHKKIKAPGHIKCAESLDFRLFSYIFRLRIVSIKRFTFPYTHLQTPIPAGI